LTLLTDGNGKTRSTVATVGENPSAKGRLPEVSLLTKIPLIYYNMGTSKNFNKKIISVDLICQKTGF
jgi:hypothetical protein